MTEIQERRADSAGRVRVETLVEVCGNEPGIPAFEAEAVDVSARGMHLRTAYLPENGAPLVCRFEDSGREIVVEGRVAWRREGGRGGEFGIEFTALDSGSVGALRELCDNAAPEADAPAAHGEPKSEVGSRVRLHIDGLGSPMKARVRESGSSNVQVGSNLEFLKVGRRLELEDLEAGGRRHAQIDGVSVAIDPQTRVPQLVVQLRFSDAADTTPEPSVTALTGAESAVKGFKIPASAVTTGVPDSREQEEQEEDDDEGAEALRGKFGEAAAHAGEAAKTAGAAMARVSARAAEGVAGLFKGAGRKVLALSRRGGETEPARRTTAPAPASRVETQRLRPQSSAALNEEVGARPNARLPKKRILIGVGGALLLTSIAALAVHHRSSPPGALAALTPAVTSVAPPAPGAPLAATPSALDTAASGVASANVPLFGPTPMATMEPAPLAPPPGSPQSVEAAEKADAKLSSSGAPLAAPAPDEGFSEEGSEGDSEKDAKNGKASKIGKAKKDSADDRDSEKSTKTDSAPWGHGKLHSPTIYRLRLDGPGGKLQGALLPTGFTVLVPNHKLMEQGNAIAKRDSRIASVHTSNRTEGAEVAFHFRDGVPAYRVRLRHDYIEFLIGEGESASSKTAKATATTKSDAKLAAHGKSHKG